MKEELKVLILSDPASSHTSKWVNSLHRKGVKIKLFGLSSFQTDEYDDDIEILVVDFSKSVKTKSDGDFRKLVYLKAIKHLIKINDDFQPDIIHAHYASSYGLIGSMLRSKRLLTSIWGNDVYDFPKKSFLHKKVFQFVLSNSLRIYSTSNIMADEICKYTSKKIKAIPFGVDVEMFKPFNVESIFDKDTIVIGAIKSLSYKYGNDIVIKSFKLVKDKLPEFKLKLLLIGDGILKNQIYQLSSDLGLNDDVKFLGHIPHSQTPMYHNMIDIHIYPSVWESFGVSNLEAAACEKVQVASCIGGFKEILNDGVDSFLVNPAVPEEFAEKLILLIKNKNLRIQMGKEARKNVIKNFNWHTNVQSMIDEYINVKENLS